MLEQKDVLKAAKKIDAEKKIVELYNKMMKDGSLAKDHCVFSDVTALELAAVLQVAWESIDMLKFELGW
jgi:hypothetical protein